jgi:ABC-type uncharacterized transport system permease subunit
MIEGAFEIGTQSLLGNLKLILDRNRTARLKPTIVLGSVLLTIFFIIAARFIWRLGLKNYSGASA